MDADWEVPKEFYFHESRDSDAFFIVCKEKTFVVQMEAGTVERFRRARAQMRSPRPLTHELLSDALVALGVEVSSVAFTRVKRGVFSVSISLSMKNELGKKIVELDARPSDALSLAYASGCPIFVSKNVLAQCADASGILKKLYPEEFGAEPEPGESSLPPPKAK